MRLEELDFQEWGQALPKEGFGPFHTPEALRVLDEHATGELHLFGGFKGQQPTGLLPVFVRERSPLRAIFSPPPGFGIRKIGPLLIPTSPKRRKQEKVSREFTEKVIDAMDLDSPFTFFYMSCEPSYSDPRAFGWAGFEIHPTFTYQIDLGPTADEILKSFSKSLRREIRDGEDADLSIRVGTTSDARKVHEATRNRYEEQGMEFDLSWDFMRDLFEALGERARVYVAESPDGGFLGGIVVLYSNDTAYFWKGGARRSYRNLSVNSLLHWRIIEDIVTDSSRDSVNRYDLYTANNERITRYKSKFNGELAVQYRVESSGVPMTVAKKAYQMTARAKRILG